MRIRRRVIARRRLLPRRVRHHPLVRAVALIAIVVLAGSIVQRTTTTAVDARRQWGRERTVIVARDRIAMGDRIEANAITTQSWPAALVPAGAISESPVGRTVIASIEPGEAVMGARLAPQGLSGIA